MQTYEQFRGHQADFVVKYRLFQPSDGGRKVTFQHLRCDFLYEGDDPIADGIYAIHPEFLDRDSRPIAENIAVPLDGKASMWILMPHMRQVHRARIKIGTCGHFVEGSRKIGDVEVVSIAALHENPDA